MKKLLAITLIFILLLGCLPVMAAATKLPTPKNLRWNFDRYDSLSYGTATWEDVPAAAGCYDIVVYRNGVKVGDSQPRDMIISGSNPHQDYNIRSLNVNMFSMSGNYTFTIQAIGDGRSYSNSDIATSPIYAFTAPTQKVATPTDLTWKKDGTLCYNGSTEEDGFYLEVYDQNMTLLCTSNYFFGNHELSSSKKEAFLGDSMNSWLSWNPDATGFYLRIRSYSANMEKKLNSNFSKYSTFYSLAENATAGKTLHTTWENALWGRDGAVKAVEQLKSDMKKYDISNQEIADSLKNNEEMTRKLSEIEDVYCQETGISVSVQEDSSSRGYLAENGIDLQKVSLVGAALNAQDSSQVNLSFSEPDQTPSFDHRFYKKAIAVNMDMEGVSDSKNLQIPVVVTIPLPDGVESSRFMILHYKEPGSVEKIYPAITYENGISATFVLTGFSPFVFAEQAVAYDPLENWVTIGSDSYIENAQVIIGAYKDGVLMTSAREETAIYEGDYNQIIFDHFDPTGADSVKVAVWKNDGSQEPLFSLCETPLPADTEE